MSDWNLTIQKMNEEKAGLAAKPEITTVCELMDEVARLKTVNANLMGDDEDKPRYTTKRLRHEIAQATSTLTASNERLMEALKPFAKYAEIMDECYPTKHGGELLITEPITSPLSLNDSAKITIGHFRAARRALKASHE